jgi:cell wall-associated NlpC family hydrolase
VVAPTVALVAVCACTVVIASRPASAGGVASARAQAAALEQRLQNIANEESAVSQSYDANLAQARVLASRITGAKDSIARFRVAVVKDSAAAQADAVSAYVNSGAADSASPLFAQNANQVGATTVYDQVAEGNLTGSVATFTNAQQTLAVAEGTLHRAEDARISAGHHEAAELASLNTLGSEVHQSQLAALRQAQLAAAQTATAPSGVLSVPNQSFPDPPPNSQANIAVRTALSFLGVPYCWGGASRRCVDCSGLTMLSWEAAGVDLPHYSGAQMADSTPVPVNDLEPGDLLFYGPGGSEHVAMYVGNGTMIEAPYTGAYVWLTPVRFGYGFAGAGRP